MMNNKQQQWKEQLLTKLPDDNVSAPVMDNNSDWEYIDSEMVKFGSLSHAQLNIDEIQKKALHLFATQTKDFRLLVHLIRTLQHAGSPNELIIAAQLLADFVRHYWGDCYPTNMKLKQRLAGQILKRFETAQDSFCKQANVAMRDDILGSFAFLAQFWHQPCPQLAEQIDALSRGYQRVETNKPVLVVEQTPQSLGTDTTQTQSEPIVTAPKLPQLMINENDERQWKQTVLKIAEILIEQMPDNGVGYRLRRYAIWNSIQALPQADNQGKTPLASVSVDRVMDYKNQLSEPSLTLINNIEQSLTLSPYWLEGHMLVAQASDKLGYLKVKMAIVDELQNFLGRLPNLAQLYFSDMTPFVSKELSDWLVECSQSNKSMAVSSDLNMYQEEVFSCYEQQGLHEALSLIETNMMTAQGPRERFYNQLLSAQLFERSGMQNMADNLYQQLYIAAAHYSLSDWEPELLNRLAQKAESKQEMTFDRDLQ